MDENFIINEYLKPLSKNFKEALNLSDDAAVLKVLKNKNLVVSVDNFIYGIHCPKYINISSGVNRAILAAISDLSAMAAKPYCIFISITLNKDNISKKLLKGLKQGISKALKNSKAFLAGGDLCSSSGAVSFSVTVIGEGYRKNLLHRKGAKPNELLCVSGNIGDAKIGLDVLLKNKKESKNFKNNYFIKKFINPPIRNDFIRMISHKVSSCIDVSDGLIFDSFKLASNSECGVEISSSKIPISLKARSLLKKKYLSLNDMITAGDDYELAFSVSEKNLEFIKKAGKTKKVKVSVIGKFTKEKKFLLDGKVFSGGYSHF
jgi:thiamine-monophosphate kinase